MRRFVWLIVSVGLTASVVGCGDSGSSGSGGSAGAGGSAGSGGSAGNGGSGGGGTMVTVTGAVTAATLAGGSVPVEGATVSVVGTSNTTTTDAQGNFSVMAPIGTALFLATAAGHWGSLLADDVPPGGLTGLDPEVIPDALVEGVGAQLGLLTPPNPSKGLVAVNFDEDLTVGGESASIDVNEGGSFIFDDDEDPVLGDTLVAGGGSDVIFINVDVAGSVTATATDASDQACSQEFPDVTYPVQAKVLTELDVVCP